MRLIAALTLFLGLFGFGGQAFAADEPSSPHFALSVDDTTLTPGQVGTLSVTFTNRQATPVTFLYTTVYASETGSAAHREFTGCTGASWCEVSAPAVRFNLVSPAVPIAPGDSRTVTLPFRFTPDSDCTAGGTVGFSIYYFYYEYAQGTYQGGQFTFPPVDGNLVCPPTP
ncbi:hypothetical protein GCM10009639_45190 [Kitasatospora putterlickiae]|uniref:Uncharacterized protein n=1 Tax=Kitasatospora putterlickiae TaxID=221725 RepID=A0ABP4J2E2_9ACTN